MNNILKIPLGDLTRKSNVFIGERSRPSSVTSISLMSDSSCVCCVFVECQMLSINFDFEKKTYSINKKIDTLYKGKPTSTDLMSSYENSTLAVSNFFKHSSSIYKYEDGDINHFYDIPYLMGDKVHGVKFYSKEIVALTSRRNFGGVGFVDIESGREIFSIKMKDYSVQDICFISKSHFITISTLGSPLPGPNKMYDSVLHEIKLNGLEYTMTEKSVMKECHLDSIVLYNGKLYTTDQYNDKVLVLDIKTLEVIDEISGYDFPHGIDINYGLLAVTNYGSNTIDIRKLNSYE